VPNATLERNKQAGGIACAGEVAPEFLDKLWIRVLQPGLAGL
jgi:hypothetical protein